MKMESPATSSGAPPGNSPFFSTVWAVVWKDIAIERRTRQTISIMLMFSLTVAVVFNFALGAQAMSEDLSAARNAAVGFLWSTILLAGTLGLNRSLANEQENMAMSALLAAPVDRAAVYVGKVISLTLFLVVVEGILLPVFIAFFNRPFWRPIVLLTLLLGTLGFVAAGVLVGTMTVQSRGQSVLLPVLLMPLTLPSVLSAATVTASSLAPQPAAWSEIAFPFSLVIAYDIMMILAGILTYHFVVEE